MDTPNKIVWPVEPHRRAVRRQLQSWYRENVLRKDPGLGVNQQVLGSMLASVDVDQDPALNFLLDKDVAEYAKGRIAEKRGAVAAGRLRRNMLSSMPLCFNLIGFLDGHRPAFADALSRAAGRAVAEIGKVNVEHAPVRAATDLGDASAFDAYIEYRDDGSRRCFFAIEVKYTEPLSPKVYCTPRYIEITEDAANGFRAGAADRLKSSKTNQIWRNTMLAMRHRELEGFYRGDVLVLACVDDDAAADAARIVNAEFDHARTNVRFVALEGFIGILLTAEDANVRAWAKRFRQRYLDLTPLVPVRFKGSGVAPT